MKKVFIGLLAFVSISAFAENCSRVVQLRYLSRGLSIVEATLENGLIGTSSDDEEKFFYQTAYVSNTKLCYELVLDGKKIVGVRSVKR